MYARVVVDVAARAVDRPFDYFVPAELERLVRVGCRVEVPFGSRAVLGFVVELSPEPITDHADVRPITRLLDEEPALTPELVELARWLAQTCVCPWITALQAMTPIALKAKPSRLLMPGPFAPAPGAAMLPDEAKVWAWLHAKGEVTEEEFLKKFPHWADRINHWLAEGMLAEKREVRDRLRPKRMAFVEPAVNVERLRRELDRLPSGAVRRRAALEALLRNGGPMELARLAEEANVPASVFRALAEAGLVRIYERETARDPYAGRSFTPDEPPNLTEDQRRVLGPIEEAVRARRHEAFLLHGVTGSGKTEVYLQAIRACLETGREAVVLVPEISLTPQTVERFKSRFGPAVAVLHSRLSPGERYDEWRKIVRREARIVVGARSAVFAPFADIGLIVLDEEHESSYKQDDSPKYHAVDVALWRGRHHSAPVLLGSATPSLERFAASDAPVNPARQAHGSIRWLSMPRRVGDRPLPDVSVVDMREELRVGNRSMFSRKLAAALEERLVRGEQAVLLMNRRGYATFVMCRACGFAAKCPHCDISLTYHRFSASLRCHYCGYAQSETRECPECGSPYIRHFGAGTQRVEEELRKRFPGARVLRMDLDTTSRKGAHERIVRTFAEGGADVLIGTQMVAKGLDFPGVTLVGIMAADATLRLPDFRSAERTFQLLAQAAGRAGRRERPGEVVIQAYDPDHYSIVCASRHDYASFVVRELAERRRLGYPPFRDLALVAVMHETFAKAMQTAERLADRLRDLGRTTGRTFSLIGPAAPSVPRVGGKYRFHLLALFDRTVDMPELLRRLLDEEADRLRRENVQVSVDVRPQNVM
ncbi:MAG: primosomal protein N' [Candidatus Reconcilbacillus cellulovorans]|uniref:Replication restart protein PriA n=1 Tax=Candidatus Reconcilbacillus cellulovorans TaxID=1906605 RepID=A0A2A6E3M2_9BACL|nr:MAG: primosomal protein N' [Candidatus Reconcilbacillus cellulovorans]